jgi:ribosome-associated translation inhibitor RaiA
MDMPVEFHIRTGSADASDALRVHVARKIEVAVERVSHRLRRVKARLIDVNGPRRGVDTRCAITAELVDGRRLFVEATAAWPFAAATQAARRLGEALRRDVRRRVTRRTRAPKAAVAGPGGLAS